MKLEIIKILLSDDSILIRKKLKDFLILSGCNKNNIIEVSDGQAAVDAYKDFKPDLVFLDIIMPKKDGIAAVTEIIEYDPTARVVVVSSIGTEKHVTQALKAGAIDFVQKPVDNEQIKKIVLTEIGGGN